MKKFFIQNLATEVEYTSDFTESPLKQMFDDGDMVREVTLDVDDQDDYQSKDTKIIK